MRYPELLAIAGSLVIMVCVTCSAAAEDMTRLALARICVSEAGFQTQTNDCAAIHAVLERRRGRGSLLRIMRLYSTRTFDRQRTDRRRWIAHLNSALSEPDGWPEQVRWANYRGRWRRVLAHAADLLAGRVAATCTPDHWGMRSGADWDRATGYGWTLIDCGRTLNAFWGVRR